MKSVKILALSAVLLLSAVAALQADDSETLIALDKKWGDSTEAAVVGKLLADDLVAISPDGLGDKAAQLENLASAPGDGPYKADEYEVRFLDKNTAIMTHHASSPEEHWSLHVWVKRDGRWQVVATSTTPSE